MLTSIKVFQTASKQSIGSLLEPNPQKATLQKTAESDNGKYQFTLQEYNKLQVLLQNRQASLRQHTKNQCQLKLFIQDLQQKNKALEKNNRQILALYKAEVSSIKKQNQTLRIKLQKLKTQNIQIKKQLQIALIIARQKFPLNHHQKHQQNVVNTETIKIIEMQDLSPNFQESQMNLKNFQEKLGSRHSPILSHDRPQFIKKQNQSKQRLQVTIKALNQLQKFLPSYLHNSRSIQQYKSSQSSDFKTKRSIKNQQKIKKRSIKKLIDIKKLNLFNQDQLINKNLNKFSSYQKFNKTNQESFTSLEIKYDDKITIKNIAKQFAQDFNKYNSKNFHQKDDNKNFSSSKNFRQNQLIKIGHYVHQNINTERIKQLSKQD